MTDLSMERLFVMGNGSALNGGIGHKIKLKDFGFGWR